jgi:hypothetical protein
MPAVAINGLGRIGRAADDRREQLRGDADRDRQGEQQRVQQRMAESDVDGEMEVVSTAATLISSLENPRSPAWNAVSGQRSLSQTAILPDAVEQPVATTTPRPAPWWTTVPMNAHELRSTC